MGESIKNTAPALIAVMLAATALSGCANKFIPPDIDYDDAAPAVLSADPAGPVQVVELPKPLPLPGQLKPVKAGKTKPEPTDPKKRIAQANEAARMQPVRNGFINSMQVYPFVVKGRSIRSIPRRADHRHRAPARRAARRRGPGRRRRHVRWIIGDTRADRARRAQVHILVKPTRPT
jgi:hypothetical protein